MERQQALLSASMQNIALRLIISRGRNEWFFSPRKYRTLIAEYIQHIITHVIII